ncbi:MAG TPA: acyl-CoA dehydrogenase family protein [Aquabacterium sp.]|nr:acyl-CoA dehydrogenase family protein [Aquabacterium sp.]HQC94139.1 acyl-CoA dehydrogenase family protein [Aquabacterium sp.]
MSTDTMQDALIEDSAAKLFSTQVDKDRRLRAEAGEWDAALWQQVTDSGFHLLLATEAAGGFGEGWTAAWPLLRGLGYWQVPLPLAETMVAAQLASLAGFALPDGPLTLIEQGEGNAFTVSGSGADATVTGTAHHVPWARHASAALVSLADGRLALLDLKAAGVTVQPHANHAGLPSDTLVLDRARLQAMAANPLPLARPAWTLGAAARSAMLVGALESALEQAVRYAGERVQFGKPLGKYQAIQQQLALMAGDVAAARVAALVAMADCPGGAQGSCAATHFSTAVAKVRTGEAATRGTSIAHQVHGAIGFTHEHALHFATRRLWAWRAEFGSDAVWAVELGRAAIAARSAGFWAGVTGKTL